MARELRENGVDPTRSPFHGKAEFDNDDEHALHHDASKAASDTALLRQLEAAYAGYQDCRSDSRASKREDEVDLAFSHYDALPVRETLLSPPAATSASPPPCFDVTPDSLKLQASDLVATLKEANDAAAKHTAQNRGGADPKFAGTSLIVDMSELDPDGLAASGYTPDLEAGRLLPAAAWSGQLQRQHNRRRRAPQGFDCRRVALALAALLICVSVVRVAWRASTPRTRTRSCAGPRPTRDAEGRSAPGRGAPRFVGEPQSPELPLPSPHEPQSRPPRRA